MKSTIFCFVKTEEEYQQKLLNGEISNKTLVFVQETREIYLDGRGYGKTSTAGLVNDEEFNNWKEVLQQRLAQLLMESTQNNQNLADRWNEELQSAINDLDLAIQEIKEDATTRSQSLTQSMQELDEALNNVIVNSDQILEDLQQTKSELEEEIRSSIQNAMVDAHGRTLWSEVNRANDGVSAITTKLNTSLDENGNVKYTSALQSVINTGINNNQAFADIASRYAVLDENQEVIEWLASGFKSQTSDSGSFSELYSAARQEDQDAIAAVKTEVLSDVENNYTAKASLSADVTNILTNGLNIQSLSNIALKSDVNSASAAITTRIDGLNTSLTNLTQQSDSDHSKIEAITSVGENSTITFNESTLDSAVAGILTKSGSNSAAQVKLISDESAAELDMRTAISNAIGGLASRVYVNDKVEGAVNTMETYIKDGDGEIVSIAALKEQSESDHSKIEAITSIDDNDSVIFNESKLDSAVAGILTKSGTSSAAQVRAISGDEASKIDIQTTVNNAVSGLASTAYVDNVVNGATTTVSAYLKDDNGTIIRSASLQEAVDDNTAKLTAIAEWNGYRDGDPVAYKGGVVTEANADGVIASLIASSGSDVSAAITAHVQNDTSDLTLSADKIYLDAGVTLANTIQATNGTIANFNIATNSLTAQDGTDKIQLSPSHFATYKNNTVSNEINTDGSGSLAMGGISWTANGGLVLSQAFLQSLFNALHSGAVNGSEYAGINETFTISNTGGSNYTTIDYLTNLSELEAEKPLWENSYGISHQTVSGSSFTRSTTDMYNWDPTQQTYPLSGTVQEKRDWYFRAYNTVGTFVSGILTSKHLEDPATHLEKDQLSELYIDHKVQLITVPTVSDIAQANSLDVNKFVGTTIDSSMANSPYLNGVNINFDSVTIYNGDQNDAWNSFIYTDGTVYKATSCTGVQFTYNSTSSYPDIFGNPSEGDWGFVEAYRLNLPSTSTIGQYTSLKSMYDVEGQIHGCFRGLLIKYTNGAWAPVPDATIPQITTVQYRANETEQ